MNSFIKRISASFMALMLALSLAACGSSEEKPENDEPQDNPSQNQTQNQTEDQKKTPSEESLLSVRSRLSDGGFIAGIIYLGYFDESSAEADFRKTMDESGCAEYYPFIYDIPRENIAANDGGELYCIVPADTESVITVKKWDAMEGEGAEGEVIYEQEGGEEPFFLMGNMSDIMPNLSVNIMTEHFSLTRYHPSISLRNGAVVLSDEDQPAVQDMTPVSFDLCVPTDTAETDTVPVRIERADSQIVLDLLKEHEIVPENVSLNSSSLDDDLSLTLDFSSALQDHISSMGSTGEALYMQSIVNAYISAFRCESLTLLSDGEAFATGHNVYDMPVTFMPAE